MNNKTKKNEIIIFGLIIAAVIGVFLFNDLGNTVSGEELIRFASNPDISHFEITKTLESSGNSQVQWVNTIKSSEIEDFKAYLKNAEFEIVSSKHIKFTDKEHYSLKGLTEHGATILWLVSYGGDFVTGHYADGKNELQNFKWRITNENWKENMERFSPENQ